MRPDQGTLETIKDIYGPIEDDIAARLAEFSRVWSDGDETRILHELVFCLLTPQSKARACWATVVDLVETGMLDTCDAGEMANALNRVRFKNNKARNVIEAMVKFGPCGTVSLKQKVQSFASPKDARDWLVDNVRGMGMKEASHFLRNIGLGDELAILDRHVLRSLVTAGIIEKVPGSINRKIYLALEKSMEELAEKARIPLPHLDFVLWYKETGDIFK